MAIRGDLFGSLSKDTYIYLGPSLLRSQDTYPNGIPFLLYECAGVLCLGVVLLHLASLVALSFCVAACASPLAFSSCGRLMQCSFLLYRSRLQCNFFILNTL
ncbi:hypothetical protein I3842_14G134500 [Carya illinoinensis]|uniref:Uncharacterized protein n=1 Tax=Carya illinoinensis TaxID=32201 RepID=A0A922D4Z1_CARIL|nr:hypothetical protein I3842_14G134500 [Carya illinoinensis]KAG6679498.1 hypothetical protein I3842_14G134500 [Carya illinoinensis]KAG6679499.1 hypothetical protein I3842_14G134500 [Carya illinoinensis]